jgi:hypothetical protein
MKHRSAGWMLMLGLGAGVAACGGSEKSADHVATVESAVTNAGPYTIGDNQIPDLLTPAIANFPDKDGNASEIGPKNASNTKLLPIATAPVPMLDYTNPNANTDLKNIWLDTRLDTAGQAWLYFGWERDAANGSAVIMIEFQHGGIPNGCAFDGSMTDDQLIANCNPWKGRDTGDFIIIWDNSGGKVVISKRVFTKNVSSTGVVSFTLSANQELNASYYKAAYNTTQTMGEAAIKLVGGLFPETPTSCESIGNIIPGTVTGNSDSADYKDTVFANYTDYVTVSLCGDVKVIKATDPAAETSATAFPFTLFQTDGGNIYYANDKPTDQAIDLYTGSLLKNTASSASVVITDLIPGTDYKILEGTLPSGWDFVSYSCVAPGSTTPITGTVKADGVVFPVVASQMTTCTITNKKQQGAVKVCKGISASKTTRVDGATFKLYSGTGTGGTLIGTKTSGSEGTGTGCSCWDGLAWGTYTVEESAPPTNYAPPTSTTQGVTVGANYTCATLPATSWLNFYNDPYSTLEAKYSFKFTDLTTHTTASLSCTSLDGVAYPTAPATSEPLTSTVPLVLTSGANTGNLVPGTYNFAISCSVVIADP